METLSNVRNKHLKHYESLLDSVSLCDLNKKDVDLIGKLFSINQRNELLQENSLNMTLNNNDSNEFDDVVEDPDINFQ